MFEKITREQADRLVSCPDCCGIGSFQAPTKNKWYERVRCARCNGKGYVESFGHPKQLCGRDEAELRAIGLDDYKKET